MNQKYLFKLNDVNIKILIDVSVTYVDELHEI
jgi:hypothetical protein